MESTEVLVVRRIEFGSALLASVIGLTWVALLVQLMRLLTEASNLLGMGSLLLTPPMGWTMLWLYSAAMVIADVGTSDSYNNADELNGAPFDANGNQLPARMVFPSSPTRPIRQPGSSRLVAQSSRRATWATDRRDGPPRAGTATSTTRPG